MMFRNHDGTELFHDIKVEQEVALAATTGEPTPDGRCGAKCPTNAGSPAVLQERLPGGHCVLLFLSQRR